MGTCIKTRWLRRRGPGCPGVFGDWPIDPLPFDYTAQARKVEGLAAGAYAKRLLDEGKYCFGNFDERERSLRSPLAPRSRPDSLNRETQAKSRELTSLLDWRVTPRVITKINLPGTRNFLLRIQQQLFPLCDPAGHPRNREQHREHRRRKSHRLVNQPGVEVHVGIQLPFHEKFVFQSDALALQRDLQQRVLAHQVKHFIRHTLDNPRARVVILVDTVPEAHQLRLSGLHALDKLRHLLHRADFV